MRTAKDFSDTLVIELRKFGSLGYEPEKFALAEGSTKEFVQEIIKMCAAFACPACFNNTGRNKWKIETTDPEYYHKMLGIGETKTWEKCKASTIWLYQDILLGVISLEEAGLQNG